MQIEAGAAFAIEREAPEDFDLRQFNTLSFQLYLNGKHLIGTPLPAGPDGKLLRTRSVCESIFVGDGSSARPLEFGRISTRDAMASDNMQELKARLVGLGTIVVLVLRGNSVVEEKEHV